jgi:ADP-dependent NAD(P)H-hydrate dehydratase
MSRPSRAPDSPRPTTPELLRGWALPTAHGSKYSRGQVVVVGGAARSPGAALLAGEAALRVGAGRLTLAVAASVSAQVAATLPECGVVPLEETADGHIRGEGVRDAGDDLSDADAVLVGPGLDDADETAELLRILPDLVGHRSIVILDAFALGVLGEVREQAKRFRGRLVLTPNISEAERLADEEISDLAPTLITIAKAYGAAVSCQNLVASAEGELWAAGTGTVGLGTSGSGDVLAGAITGLCARRATPQQAAVWGTYLHASAGDALATRIGSIGFLARELLPELPNLLDRLRPS